MSKLHALFVSILALSMLVFACTSGERAGEPLLSSGAQTLAGQYVVAASYVQPAIGATVSVSLTSAIGLAQGQWLSVVDPTGNQGLYTVASLAGTTATLTNKGGFGGATAGTTFAARAVATWQNASIGAQLSSLFGNGTDGVLTPLASGTLTLSRDMSWSAIADCPSGSTYQINVGSSGSQGTSRIRVSGRASLKNCPAGFINGHMSDGLSATSSTGAAATATWTIGSVGQCQTSAGSAGGAGTSTTLSGNTPARSDTVGIMLGGLGGSGGIGGTGPTGSVGTTGATLQTVVNPAFDWLADGWWGQRSSGGGELALGGGCGGSGGSGGSGNTGITGGGGGAGGNGGSPVSFAANELYTDSTTSAGVISANGGNGGNGWSPNTGVGASGGGGGGGGGGGFVNVIIGSHSGAGQTNTLQANGGLGGQGGDGDGAGSDGGAGGDGGSGGRIYLYNLGLGTLTQVLPSLGDAGVPNSGAAHGDGGAGGVSQLTL